ncbi:GOLD domain-containing protein [Plasmodiophora brassicae]|uniref:GOLD domain-containing protein n=1 Tax=Plasmodiophora brassicae TaxID=37360 RepID=A0A3P3YPM6_PLABS|nr:unnamed protein product [Plasmodiophora brassicae]
MATGMAPPTLAVVVLLIGAAGAFQFEVQPSRTRCIGEDMPKGDVLRMKYKVSPPQAGVINMILTDPFQKELTQKVGEPESSVVVTSQVAGEHRACFFNVGAIPVTLDLTMSAGASAKDYDAIAKKENLKPLELELRRLEDLVVSVHSEMQYMRTREQAHRNTNESTNGRVLYFSLFSMGILVFLGTWQLYYLHKFFKTKKML